jgi:hypothetical protein
MPAKGQESMDQTDLWSRHLKPGERLLWEAGASDRLRRAEIGRRRAAAILIGFSCLVLAAAFGWKLYETFLPGQPQPNLGAAVAMPLYAALALTFLAVFIAQLGRLNPKLSRAVRYAATDARLISADAKGAIIDQIDVQEIAGVILGGRRAAPDIFVLRTHDDLNVRTFAIEHIDKPLAAKAFLEEQFLEHDAVEAPQ